MLEEVLFFYLLLEIVVKLSTGAALAIVDRWTASQFSSDKQYIIYKTVVRGGGVWGGGVLNAILYWYFTTIRCTSIYCTHSKLSYIDDNYNLRSRREDYYK